MPPRKATTDGNDPPRRSGRITSQPVAEAKPNPKAEVTKKRTAVEEAKEGSSAKKVLKPFFFWWRAYTNIIIFFLLG